MQPRAERFDHLQELLEVGVNPGETPLMGDDFGQLGDEPEVRIRLPGPGLHGDPARGGVEGGVSLDRVAPAGIVAKPLLSSGRAGLDPPEPRFVGPHRTADMQAHRSAPFLAAGGAGIIPI